MSFIVDKVLPIGRAYEWAIVLILFNDNKNEEAQR